jgi:hypothetical protein
MSASLGQLLQYLLTGDILGLLQAIYMMPFGDYYELFYGFLALIGIVPIYIRSNSLLLCSILWILVGYMFMVMAPAVTIIATLLMVLGIGGTLFSLYRGTKASYG